MYRVSFTLNGRKGTWTCTTRERADSLVAHVVAKGGAASYVQVGA